MTGIESCTTVKMDVTTYDGPNSHSRNLLSVCVDETSDPRVAGTFRDNFNEDCYVAERFGITCLVWGTYVMEGDERGWDCSYAGTGDIWSPNVGQVFAACTGTGEYEGLSYVFHHVFGGRQEWGDGTDIRGIIYKGPPPTWGPLPSPTSE